MTVPTVVPETFATAIWANAVSDALNRSVLGGDSLFELAPAPTGSLNELRWSSVHGTLMRWDGTQWVLADGTLAYMQSTSYHGVSVGPDGTFLGGGFWVQAFSNAATLDQPTAIQLAARHPGVVRIVASVGGTNSGLCIGTQVLLSNATDGLRFRAVFQIPTAGATTVTRRIGFHDQFNIAGGLTNGAYLEVVGDAAVLKTTRVSATTTNVTTVTLTAGTWYTVHIQMKVASARCIVMDDLGNLVYDATNSTNVPTGANLFAAAAEAWVSAPASQPLLYIDYVGYGYDDSGVAAPIVPDIPAVPPALLITKSSWKPGDFQVFGTSPILGSTIVVADSATGVVYTSGTQTIVPTGANYVWSWRDRSSNPVSNPPPIVAKSDAGGTSPPAPVPYN
jgi:hypothetical protein